MSRSIHTTRKHIEELRQADFADREQRQAEIEKLCEELSAKRRTKLRVKGERNISGDDSLHTPPESVPIIEKDVSDFVHYPASAEDIRNILRLLPQGVTDGLEGIQLCLGTEFQKEHVDREGELETDPLTGRPGRQVFPGVYLGECLGVYFPRRAKIEVFAYVYDPSLPDRAMWEFALRLKMLSTLVHEVAHHYDLTMRVARGRWRADSRDKLENYAEVWEHSWIQEYVVPYLISTYPTDWAQLDSWIVHHGGISIPLNVLAGDPRATCSNGLVSIQNSFYGVDKALWALAEDVAAGKTMVETRLEFARELHYVEFYDEATQIIEGILASDTSNLEALTLKADILCHQEEYQQARPIVKQVLAADPDSEDAIRALLLIIWSEKDWSKFLSATSHILEDYEISDWDRLGLLLDRAEAYLEMGQLELMGRELDAMTRLKPNRPGVRSLWDNRIARVLEEAERRYPGGCPSLHRPAQGATENDQ